MVAEQVGELITGRIEAVNERGVKINGGWKNLSRWAEDVTLPSKGETVTLRLDKQGFIRGVERQGGAGDSLPENPGANRDRSIIRQVALKAAVELAAANVAAGHAFKSEDVLIVAAKFEAWMNRSFDQDGAGEP